MEGGAVKNAACCVALHMLLRWLTFAGASADSACCVGRRSTLCFRVLHAAFSTFFVSVYLCIIYMFCIAAFAVLCGHTDRVSLLFAYACTYT